VLEGGVDLKALGYGTLTKVLHLSLIVAVIVQLALATGMEHPKPGTHPDWWRLELFEGHEFVGLLLLMLVVVHLIHTLRDAGDESAWHILFPWLRQEGREQLRKELKMVPGWLRNGPPPQDVGIALPGTVHGAGLLLLLAMGLSGLVIFFGMGEDGSHPEWVHAVMEFHADGLGTLLWIFLIGHAGMGFWHERLGHKSKSRIFFS